jgi:phosphoglycolate phosphatase-like HAD superfamily hydrolase
MPRIVTDIDGTIIDAGKPVQRVLDYIKAEAEEVVVLTNRPESDREKTVADLKATGLTYSELIMNKDGTPAPEFKAAAVKAMLDDGVEVDPRNIEAAARAAAAPARRVR